jgi:hypothetical protein
VPSRAAAAAVDRSLRQIHFATNKKIKNTLKKINQKSAKNDYSKINFHYSGLFALRLVADRRVYFFLAKVAMRMGCFSDGAVGVCCRCL